MLIKQDAQKIKEVLLDDCKNSLEEFVAVVRFHAEVRFSESYKERVKKSRKSLEEKLSDGIGVYGVNTGFGDNVRYRINEEDMIKLQENIIRSHGCSVGQAMEKEELRAMMLLLLVNIGKGYSAVRLDVLELVREFLNKDIYPYVPCEGSIGGLSFQPYMAMTFMGEGRIIDNGKVRDAAEVLCEKGIKPVHLAPREGLALLSNASGSAGAAMLAVYDYIMTLRHSDLCAALVCEALGSTDKAYDSRLMALKGHKDQIETAEYLRKVLAGSQIMEESRNRRVQDSTNTRVIPHMHGAAKRLGRDTFEVVMEEFKAVSDNPVFMPDGSALMGSNWDATLIETYCDALVIGVVNMAKLMEVHMERLVDPHLSGLPAFLVKSPGLNNGFMIVQYVTAGLLGDITMLTTPAGTYNAAVSAGQESPICRDDAAVRKLHQAVKKLERMVSLTILTAMQALDFREYEMSPVTKKLYDEVRKTVSFMEDDDLMYLRIEEMERIVESHRLLEIAQDEIGEFTV